MNILYHFIPNLKSGGAEKILYNWVKEDKEFQHVIFAFSGGDLESFILTPFHS